MLSQMGPDEIKAVDPILTCKHVVSDVDFTYNPRKAPDPLPQANFCLFYKAENRIG